MKEICDVQLVGSFSGLVNESTPVAPRDEQPKRPKNPVVTVDDTVDDCDLDTVDDTVVEPERDSVLDTEDVCVDEPDRDSVLDTVLDTEEVCVVEPDRDTVLDTELVCVDEPDRDTVLDAELDTVEVCVVEGDVFSHVKFPAPNASTTALRSSVNALHSASPLMNICP
jgi:hypothetical protein